MCICGIIVVLITLYLSNLKQYWDEMCLSWSLLVVT